MIISHKMLDHISFVTNGSNQLPWTPNDFIKPNSAIYMLEEFGYDIIVSS